MREFPSPRDSIVSVAPGTREDVDAPLIEALRRDDPDATEQLVERYGGRVYRLAARIIGAGEDAENVAQDALWAVARDIHTFTGELPFSSWIDRIAANGASQRLHARRQESGEIALEDVLPSLDDDGRHFAPMDDWSSRLDRPAIQGGVRQILTDAIAALPPDYRTVLVLHDVEGVSNPEIAETLGVSLPTVKARVHRARLFVRKHVADHLEPAQD